MNDLAKLIHELADTIDGDFEALPLSRRGLVALKVLGETTAQLAQGVLEVLTAEEARQIVEEPE